MVIPRLSNNSDVCISSVGACTAIGASAPTSAAAVRAGIAGFAEHPYMIDKFGDRMIVARAPYLPDDMAGVDRYVGLALPAAQEALSPLSGLVERMPPIPVIIGLPAKRPGLPDAVGDQITAKLKDAMNEFCRVSEMEALPSGHAAGLMAIEAGWRKIQSGAAEFCLAGGIDGYLEPETLEWLDECDQLHSSINAWGFVPGEAAGFCLLSSARAVEEYKLRVLGRLLTVVTAREQNLIKTETVCIGQGLSEAVRQVLQALPASGAKIDQTICDMNGETYRADEYGFTMARTAERFVDASDFVAPADCWGDVGAASGPLFVNLAAAAGLKGYAQGPHTLIWTSSEGGERSAALLQVNGPL